MLMPVVRFGDGRDVQLDIAQPQLRGVRELFAERPCSLESADPVGKVLSQAELNVAHAFDAADQRQLAVTVIDHAGGFNGADHACRASQ